MNGILLIAEQPDIVKTFTGMLAPVYEVYCVGTPEAGMEILNAQHNAIVAVLVELAVARHSGFALSEWMKSFTSFSLIPMIAISDELPTSQDMDCIEHGYFDLITAYAPQPLVYKRIANAIRAKDSLSLVQLEKMLQQLPSCIFLKDTEGKYVFSTQIWHHLDTEGDPNWTIRGKTDLEIRKDKDNALKAMESDREIVRSGEGVNYILQEKADGLVEYLELIKRPVRDERGAVTGIVALINNVTAQQLLKMELEKRAQVDMLTELLNKVTTQELIDMRIDGCRRKKTMGTLMMIDVDNFKSVNDTYGHVIGDRVLAELGRVFRTSFRGTDVAGRVGGDEFMLFIPELATREAAEALARRIKDQVTKAFAGSPVEGKITISIGAALFPEHGQSFEELYRAADKALYTVKRNGKADFHFYTEA